MWMREHQRPWTLGAIVAADAIALKHSLLEHLDAGRYRRAWLVVGGDHGWWREERLCRRRGGDWAFVIDGGTDRSPDGSRTINAEPRVPAHPELIPELEETVRELIARDGIAEGVLHVAAPGLLLLCADADARTLYGLAGYREPLELFWRIRLSSVQAARVDRRLGRGTGAGE